MVHKNKKQDLKDSITQEIKKEWLSPTGVYQDYGLSISTLAKWRMQSLYLPYSKIGKFIKYKRADIEAFLNDNMVTAINKVS